MQAENNTLMPEVIDAPNLELLILSPGELADELARINETGDREATAAVLGHLVARAEQATAVLARVEPLLELGAELGETVAAGGPMALLGMLGGGLK